jgi:RsiW-degrading membrane proteinase PrsW (M82 family)
MTMSDTIKLVVVYVMAAIIIVGGGAMLFYSRNEGNSDFSLVVAGFIGTAVAFLFGQESATRAVRSYERGLNTPTPPPPGE